MSLTAVVLALSCAIAVGSSLFSVASSGDRDAALALNVRAESLKGVLGGTTGNDKTWVEPPASVIDIEDIPLLEFLEWFARETGRRLEFVDDDVRKLAKTIRMHGSVRNLTPEEALSSVMAATSLSFQLSEGVIRVSSTEKQKSRSMKELA